MHIRSQELHPNAESAVALPYTIKPNLVLLRTKAERASLRHGRVRVEQQANETALAPALAKVSVQETRVEEAEAALAVWCMQRRKRR